MHAAIVFLSCTTCTTTFCFDKDASNYSEKLGSSVATQYKKTWTLVTELTYLGHSPLQIDTKHRRFCPL